VFYEKKTLPVRRSLISSFHFLGRSREPAKKALLAYLANSKPEATDRLRMLLSFLSFTFPLARPLANTPTARWRLHIWEGSLDRSHLSLTRPTSKNGTLQTKSTNFEAQQEPMIGSLVTLVNRSAATLRRRILDGGHWVGGGKEQGGNDRPLYVILPFPYWRN